MDSALTGWLSHRDKQVFQNVLPKRFKMIYVTIPDDDALMDQMAFKNPKSSQIQRFDGQKTIKISS